MELLKSYQATLHTTLTKSKSPVVNDLEVAFGQTCAYDIEIRRVFLDQAFRNYLKDFLCKDLKKINLEDCKTFILLSIQASRSELCSKTLPIGLLADVFDVITITRSEQMFGFVEANVAVWKESFFFDAIKNNLLRVCNDLLRRLSRSQNTVFCGRILLFLANFFPFSERSGLNVISEFNLENTTVFNEDSTSFSAEDLMEIDDAVNAMVDDKAPFHIEADQKNLRIDYNLYSKFWQLQDFFRNPVQCYNTDGWKKFSSFSDDVLKTFQSFKIESALSTRNPSDESKSGRKDDERFFAKYLTNQNLLQLQLSDSNFRRYIYVQLLILFQYLQSTVKFKQDTFVLSDDQTEWVKATRAKIFQLLKDTPPNGSKFAEAVEHLLKREEQWNTWKNDGCPALVTASAKQASAARNGEQNGTPAVVGSSRKRKRKLGDQVRDATANGKFLMGNVALTKLWNICPDNLEACAAIERDFLPSVDEYFSEAVEQLDPENKVEEAYKKVNDGQWGWRALRLLAKKSPHFFTYGNNPIAKLPDYLDSMLKKMAASGLVTAPTRSIENSSDKMDTDKSENKEDTKAEEEAPTAFVCTPEQLEKLAENLSNIEGSLNKLIPKLGLLEEKLTKEFEEKKVTEEKDKILVMLNMWSKEEGSGATNEEIIYILEGVKMPEAVKDVFPVKE